jgi:hypothetical protein
MRLSLSTAVSLLVACGEPAPTPAPPPPAAPTAPAPPPAAPEPAAPEPAAPEPAAPVLHAGPARYTLPGTHYRECEGEMPICGARIVDLAAGTSTAVYTLGPEKPGWWARDGEGGEPRPVTVDFIATPGHPDRVATRPAGGPGGSLRVTVGHADVPGPLELQGVQWLAAEVAVHRGKLYGLGTRTAAPNKPRLLEIDPTTAAVREIVLAGVQFGDVYPGRDALVVELTRKGKPALARLDPVAGKLLAEVALPADKDFQRRCDGPVYLDESGIVHVEGDRVYGGFLCVPVD